MLRPVLLLTLVSTTAVLCACGADGSDAATTSPSTSPSTTSATSPPSASATDLPTTASSSGPSDTATGSTGGPSGGSVERCHTSQLTASVALGDSGAGQRHGTVRLTNRSSQTCSVHGYGGMALVSSSGRQLPTDVVREPASETTVVLAPGKAVESAIHWGAVPGDGDSTTGDCQPTAKTLWVTPPDETDHVSTAWPGGPVCQQGTIEQKPYGAS